MFQYGLSIKGRWLTSPRTYPHILRNPHLHMANCRASCQPTSITRHRTARVSKGLATPKPSGKRGALPAKLYPGGRPLSTMLLLPSVSQQQVPSMPMPEFKYSLVSVVPSKLGTLVSHRWANSFFFTGWDSSWWGIRNTSAKSEFEELSKLNLYSHKWLLRLRSQPSFSFLFFFLKS